MKKSALFFMLFFPPILFGMEEKDDKPKLNVYAVRDMTNKSLSINYLYSIYPQGTNIQYGPPHKSVGLLSSCDMGQNYPIGPLKKSNEVKNVLHGSLLGTAAILNAFGRKEALEPDALILESPVMSVNSAICHTVQNFVPPINKIPGFYYWGPYVARILFLRYAPSGQQPIKSIDKVPNNIPILIVHPPRDINSSYDDSCALYYRLKEKGNNDVYLISHNYGVWCDFLNSLFVKKFLSAHEIIGRDQAELITLDLSKYQPEHQQFKTQYENLVNKEKNHEQFFYFVPTTLFLSFCYVMHNHIGKIFSYLKVFGRVT